MGQCLGAKKEDGMKKQIREKREAASKKMLPHLALYKVNPAIMAISGQNFGGGGGGQLSQIAKGATHQNALPSAYVPKCIVSGKEAPSTYNNMTAGQCSNWAPAGDLLISEAERISRQHQLQDKFQDGEERLKAIYDIIHKEIPSSRI